MGLFYFIKLLTQDNNGQKPDLFKFFVIRLFKRIDL